MRDKDEQLSALTRQRWVCVREREHGRQQRGSPAALVSLGEKLQDITFIGPFFCAVTHQNSRGSNESLSLCREGEEAEERPPSQLYTAASCLCATDGETSTSKFETRCLYNNVVASHKVNNG